jgi:hypothetical protein
MTKAATIASRFGQLWYVVYKRPVRGCCKQLAKVAIARRPLAVVCYILKRNEPYQEDYLANRRGASSCVRCICIGAAMTPYS